MKTSQPASRKPDYQFIVLFLFGFLAFASWMVVTLTLGVARYTSGYILVPMVLFGIFFSLILQWGKFGMNSDRSAPVWLCWLAGFSFGCGFALLDSRRSRRVPLFSTDQLTPGVGLVLLVFGCLVIRKYLPAQKDKSSE